MPQNATITPVIHSESTMVSISWSAPTDLKGNDAKKIQYQVNYCTINNNCNKFTKKSVKTNVVLKNLIPRHIYQFTIRVFNENDESGDESVFTYFFKTPYRGSFINN
jgi:Fibronectin type III domain.